MGRRSSKRIHRKGNEPAIDYLKRKTEKIGDCWIWKHAKNTRGYGITQLKEQPSNTKLAHRVMYELIYGKLSPNLHLDHLCRNRACINPDHLEPVTSRINRLRALPYLELEKEYKLKLAQKTNPIDWGKIETAFLALSNRII